MALKIILLRDKRDSNDSQMLNCESDQYGGNREL